MKVLFIYPEFPKTFWSFSYALSFIGKKSAFPPLGLITVASLLPETFEKRLVDLNVERLRKEDLSWADMVFLSSMTIQRNSAREIIAVCREQGLKIVAGGPLFTAEPEAFPEVDHLVLNEAECTLPLFLEDLEKGTLKKIYRADEFCDIQHTPTPSWELVRMKKYASMSVQFSRGCPFNCDFCNITALLGHKTRMKTPGQVLAELDCIYDAGWRGVTSFSWTTILSETKHILNQNCFQP